MKNLTVVAIAALISLPILARAESVSAYKNERYGYSVSLPQAFKADPAPQNGDGRRVRNGKGCSITVSGGNNINEESLAAKSQSSREEFEKVTYQTKGDSWLVLSGYKGSEILYLKVFIGAGSMNTLRVQYPKTDDKNYQQLVTQVSKSFRPGDLGVGH